MLTPDHSSANRRCWLARRRTASRLIGTGTTPIPTARRGRESTETTNNGMPGTTESTAMTSPRAQVRRVRRAQPAESAGAVTHHYLRVAAHRHPAPPVRCWSGSSHCYRVRPRISVVLIPPSGASGALGGTGRAGRIRGGTSAPSRDRRAATAARRAAGWAARVERRAVAWLRWPA